MKAVPSSHLPTPSAAASPLANPQFEVKARRRSDDLVEQWRVAGVNMEAGSPRRRFLRTAHLSEHHWRRPATRVRTRGIAGLRRLDDLGIGDFVEREVGVGEPVAFLADA